MTTEILAVINIIGIILIIAAILLKKNGSDLTKDDVSSSVNQSMQIFSDMLKNSIKDIGQSQNERFSSFEQYQKSSNETYIKQIENYQKSSLDQFNAFDNRMSNFSSVTEQKLENMRQTMEKRLETIQNDNNQKLDDMRQIVDEKLQKTLNERMTESFKLVNERLEQVYKGLGEMQTLAQGVGDLKKVLSNVKTRGIVGEIQLGAILEEILSPEQYDTNVATIPNSRNVVEYAVKLPSEDGSFIYLPIDAKFPADTYAALKDAYDEGNAEKVNSCLKALTSTIKSEAKDIHDKYIEPPYTTDFAIMFLPFEGLYAEVVNRGLIEILQKDYHVNVAGPSTMAALLNSLQMGFRTVAIQKRSAEVWNVLGAVKTEFDKFADVLAKTQQRLTQASDELDKLVGTRTKAIQKKLKDVTRLDDTAAENLLDSSSSDIE